VSDNKAMNKTPLASVVFLEKNAGSEFEKVLEMVFAQQADFPFEVIAIDSGSTDGTWELLDKFPIRKIRIKPYEFMHGRTRNYAMELAKGRIVVFLVQDALPVGRKWLSDLTAPLRNGLKKTNSRIAGVTGRQIPPENLPLPQEYYVQHSHAEAERPMILDKVPTIFGPGKIWFSNVCSAIDKEAWRQVNFPDVVMSEDQAWTIEVLKRGWTLAYEPKATVKHGHALSLMALFKRNVDSGASFASLGTVVPSIGSGKNWRWLADEIKFGFNKQGLSGAFYVMAYELTRFIGFQTGYRRFVPWQIKKTFSVVPQWYGRSKSNH